jgi:hypothetical protein
MNRNDVSVTGKGKSALDTDALREEIVKTRETLGKAVEAVAAKVDVRARAKERKDLMAAQARVRMLKMRRSARNGCRTIARRPGPVGIGVLGIAAVATVLIVAAAKRRER